MLGGWQVAPDVGPSAWALVSANGTQYRNPPSHSVLLACVFRFCWELEPLAWVLARTSPACRKISARIAWELRTLSFRNIHNHRFSSPMPILEAFVDGSACFLKRVEAVFCIISNHFCPTTPKGSPILKFKP